MTLLCRYLKTLENGISVPVMIYTYTPGGSVINQVFVWRVPDSFAIQASLSVNQKVISKLNNEMPIYHTRAMRQEFVNHFGHFMQGAKPYELRTIYQELTKDCSASRTLDEQHIDQRISEALALEDDDVLVDLRHQNEGRAAQYDVFWTKCNEFIAECSAVHDRRHGDSEISYMATAISVRDMITQVKQKCPPDAPIPSEAWVRLNFSPKNPRAKVSMHYHGKLKLKHVIQKRLVRKSHPDEHYCAALFRYQRELAVKYRSYSVFISIDDKHRIKIGEPGYPVAAVERGRQVIVSQSQIFAVGDHDFTKFSLIPSVALQIDIPEKFEGSWYRGKVLIGLKDAVFQSSSPLRHASELYGVLTETMGLKTFLFIYCDGGPDHRLTYVSVQLSLIALFLNLNLDFLVACRTAPNHSWKNPVERVMSLLNVGLQCVGMMRTKMSDEFESAICNANNLQQLREAALSRKEDVASSLKPAIDLLKSIFRRLELKGEAFELYEVASDEEIYEFWSVLLLIDSTVTMDTTTKKLLKSKTALCKFIEHCCRARHYSFQIKKCGESSCTICKPVRVDAQVFETLTYLPDPIPENDDHYKNFTDIYGQTTTTEKYRPSLTRQIKRKIDFTPSQQHVKNVGMLVQCEECDKWRLMFCRHKLNRQEVATLAKCLDDVSYTCGVLFSDLDLPGRLKGVCVKDHACVDHIEKLYYSCGFELICCYCAKEVLSEDTVTLPMCKDCQDEGKTPINRPKTKEHA